MHPLFASKVPKFKNINKCINKCRILKCILKIINKWIVSTCINSASDKALILLSCIKLLN